MNKFSQQLPALITLRNSILNFHQNIRIGYNKLQTASGTGVIQKALLEAYKPYLESLAKSGVFGTQFTTEQLRQHLRYLEGMGKKLAGKNVMTEPSFLIKYQTQPYYQNIFLFGNKVKDNFVSLATGIKSGSTDEELIKNAAVMSNLFNKVGANFVTLLSNYLGKINSSNVLGKNSKLSVNKIILSVDNFCNLLKNSSNLFIPSFDENNNNILHKIALLTKDVTNIKDNILLLEKEYNKYYAVYNHLLKSKNITELKLNNIYLEFCGLEETFYPELFNDIQYIFYRIITILNKLNISNIKSDSLIKGFGFINVQNNKFNIVIPDFNYAKNFLEKAQQIDLTSSAGNLVNILLEEENNPSNAMKLFVSDITRFIELFCSFCQQVDPKHSNKFDNISSILISDMEENSNKFINEWDSKFDQMEYEEKINTTNPEDLEY